MAITVFFTCFLSSFFCLLILSGRSEKLSLVFIKTVILFSVILVGITELLSALHALNFRYILIFWSALTLLNLLFLYREKEKLAGSITGIKKSILFNISHLNRFEKFLFYAVAVLLILVFVQGVLYPPNNWDSMTYHMARIPSWISHQSVEHYPTHIYRQLFQPPFSEYIILHCNILSRNDLFSNAVQFFYLVFSLFAISLLVDHFGLHQRLAPIAIIFTVTIPEVILQASSTQNDIVVAFFILCTLYFTLKTLKDSNPVNHIYLGLAAGLAALSKGTAYIYVLPILLYYAIIVLTNLIKRKNFAVFKYPVIACVLYLSINAGHYYRNYTMSGHVLGIDHLQTPARDFNENMTLPLLLSSVTKNVGIHLGPYPLSVVADRCIWEFHHLLGLNISANNFNNKSYYVTNIPNSENSAPNPLHFLLIVAAISIILYYGARHRKDAAEILIYILILVVQATLFCAIFKWTPWHSRLHIPLFLVAVPLIGYAIARSIKFSKIMPFALLVMLLYAFGIVIFNRIRPLITVDGVIGFGKVTSSITVYDSRFKKYFACREEIYDEYNVTNNLVQKMNCNTIGIELGNDDWEYPFFLNCYSTEICPVSINVGNISKSIPPGTHVIDCIVSTTTNQQYIEYKGRKFYNLLPANTLIWLYR